MIGLKYAGQQFIGGKWVSSTSPDRIPVENPATTEVLAEVAAGSSADAAAAVAAARASFPAWAATSLDERIAIVTAAARLLEADADEIAETITAELGSPLSQTKATQVGRSVEVLDSLARAARKVEWSSQIGATAVYREPVGVVVAITPWNFPLHQAVAKVGAALVAGCTVILKPSEMAPLNTYALADAFAAAGLPAGALNIVTGRGDMVGEALVEARDVDAVSFTGSTAVGRRIAATGAATIKRVSLELGGKGPSIALPDADIAAVAKATAARCFGNSGQVCASLTRLLVPSDRVAEAEAAAAKFADALTVGDPMDDATVMGPVISGAHRDRVRGYIEKGLDEGARLVTGGLDAEVPAGGHYVAATVFSDVTPSMTIAREEIFGPVLSIIGYASVDEAVDIANDSDYGLVGAVWGADAPEIARRLRVGLVGVNGGRLNVDAPFGGYKQSGYGREFGVHGIEEFLEIKSANYTAEADVVL
ncbi:aldehyde dehydrogenase family protein [Streptomyces sp. NPDC050625]|uniref:aldehyde dehydrogenase family protein n=1 Tax=Streptomyces sp. NPDC050625 TaxID=3154629 RepID=UPI003425C965